MKTYEISNPGDAYTIQTTDPKAAQMATLLLGNGAYGLTDEDDNQVMPIFLLGGGAEFVKREFGGVGAWIKDNLQALIDALESVQIGGFAARKELDAALACMAEDKRAHYLAQRHDRLRTSLNDIGGAARDMAAQLRKRLVS